MPRAAGNKNYYTFTLRTESGRYRRDVEIKLPSVTHIIGSTLAKPMLVGWAYRTTRDHISGLVSVLAEPEAGTDMADLLDLLTDADALEEYLKDNALRPEDIKMERAEEGSVAHEFLEDLANCQLKEGDDQKMARDMLNSNTPALEKKAIAAWWLDRNPVVMQSETVLYSLAEGFAGTVDLVYYAEGDVVICDLKSRKEGSAAYDSDHVQCCAYEIAWNEFNPKRIDRRTVLIARLDGTWDEYPGDHLDTQVFRDVLSVYRGLRPKMS